jgi:hypothetical protein
MISSQFKNIINDLKHSGYSFKKFSIKSKKGLFLRFDVDISITNALLIAKYLAKQKIVANFFFQPNNEIYNIFNKKNKSIINEIYNLNHLIGLHVDENFFSIKEKDILNMLNFFQKNKYYFSNVISFHRPSQKVLKKKYKKIINTYENNFFNNKNYISDSGKNLFFKKKIKTFLKENNKLIQILMHPIWWSKITKTEKIYLELKKNSHQNLNNYLMDNFPKVFGNVVLKKKYLFKL